VVVYFGHGRALRPQLRQLLANLDVPVKIIDTHEFICFCLYSLGKISLASLVFVTVEPQLGGICIHCVVALLVFFLLFVLFCGLSGIVLFVLTLRNGYFRYQFGTFAWTHMTMLLVILQTSWMSANIFRGLFWFVLPAFLVVANDTSAYMFGRAFGRTPLIKLSPKKTVEGFVGATGFTIVFAFMVSFFFLILILYSFLLLWNESLTLIP
jgi:phosphatidate cytidylyltransferase